MLADLLSSTALGGVDGWACAPWCVGLCAAVLALSVLWVRRAMLAAERDMRARGDR